MSDESDIMQQRLWTTRQMLVVIIAVISITFTGTMIWSNFVFMESEINVNEDRATKRYNRITEEFKIIWEEINELKKKE